MIALATKMGLYEYHCDIQLYFLPFNGESKNQNNRIRDVLHRGG